ncbi:substrate-binding domain-containing protein [Burkholderia sp. FERM BP-3421]|uniref:substrate-binding domain-containing protein n=1 Tax=Burkholderia sp. FERM BP-3421 TaxID=1494466 RepID=UPI002362608F|nr:substrate-binding domain-containing protein [Burkholderia sp. FERM BP-3421]WDD91355.1 substrate-binding domain-containing protein [Burkholderia sp. FERM BP-3421]
MKFLASRSSMLVGGLAMWFAASIGFAQQTLQVTGGGPALIWGELAAESAATGGGITYYPAGEGRGVFGFLQNDLFQFGMGLTGNVQFAYSGYPLSSVQTNEVGEYARSSTDGRLIQLPYIVLPVTVSYVGQPGDVPATVSLNDDDLCGIFSGRITTWDQVINPATAQPYTARQEPVTVVYNSETSGATLLFTNHLSTVCNPLNSRVRFDPILRFDGNFPPSTGVPPTFIAEASDSAVARRLVELRGAHKAAFAYLSPHYTNTTLAPGSAIAASNQLTVANVRNRNSGLDVAPTYQNAAAAFEGARAPELPADKANPYAWRLNTPNPAQGYPISGANYIVVSQCYVNHKPIQRTIFTWLGRHYGDPNFLEIVRSYGFDLPPSGYVDIITSDILSNRHGLNLNIGNVQACGTRGR